MSFDNKKNLTVTSVFWQTFRPAKSHFYSWEKCNLSI